MYTTDSHPNHALPQQTVPELSQPRYPASKDAVKAVDIPCGRVFPDGVVRYIVEVAGSESTWLIAKRYSQFETLHLDLIQLFLDLGHTHSHIHSHGHTTATQPHVATACSVLPVAHFPPSPAPRVVCLQSLFPICRLRSFVCFSLTTVPPSSRSVPYC